MKTSAISYECLTFMFDYEELGRVSFNYAIGDLHGSVLFDDCTTTVSIITKTRIYIVELDITPHRSMDIASYWAKTIVGEFAQTKKNHQSMKSFASKHLITKSCYSSSRTNRKLIVEYL